MVDYCFSHVEAIGDVFQKKCRLSVDCEKCTWYISYLKRKSKFWGTRIINSNRIAFLDGVKDSGRHGRLLLLSCRSDWRRFSKKVSAERRLREMHLVHFVLKEKIEVLGNQNHQFESDCLPRWRKRLRTAWSTIASLMSKRLETFFKKSVG